MSVRDGACIRSGMAVPHPSRILLALLALLATWIGDRRASAGDFPVFGACIGDCNLDGRVSIDEIILDVRVVLGDVTPDRCGAGGGSGIGAGGINGLVTAVLNSLQGCTTLQDHSDFTEFRY